MNLSLLIIVIMLAVVLPTLARRFFFSDQEKPQATFFEAGRNNSEEITTARISDVDDASLLFSPIKQKLYQKELISHNIRIIAKDENYFRGYELLQALEDVGLTYGEKDLFYYTKNKENLFSVAPITPPHVFYLDEIGSFFTNGLEFVLIKNQAYMEMRAIAEKLAEELEGEIHEGD